MAKNDRFPGGFQKNASERAGESKRSGGRLGRVGMESTVSGDSDATMRKCINLNSEKRDSFGVPRQVLPSSNMSPFERKDLIQRLRLELEQIRMIKKKVEFQRTNGFTISSSSDILSPSSGQNGPHIEIFQKSSMMNSVQGNKVSPLSSKGRGWNRGTSGRFESSNEASAPSTANAMIMQQCETLLKRLMSHQYGWVFNTPVDVVKLKIPDYLTVIKEPMDLGTIKKKIASGVYSSPKEFLNDIRLTFTNAMTYNPCGNDVHSMADTLSQFFEVRWKSIEKKLAVTDVQPLPAKSGPCEEIKSAKSVPPLKKRKITTTNHEVMLQPIKLVVTDEEKQNLSRDLESLLGEIPVHIIDFLREHSSNGTESGEDEIEIDIYGLTDDTLFTLRKLINDYLQEKQKNLSRAEPCEIELLHGSGLSNSSMQPYKGNGPVDEDVDIVGNEPPVSSYPHVEIEKDIVHKSSKCISSGSSGDSDSSSSSASESNDAKALNLLKVTKVQEAVGSDTQFDECTSDGDLDRNQSVSGLDQLEQHSQQKPSSVESDCCQEGDGAPTERQVSPEKLYRAAVLKNRFADTILKAREKTLKQGERGDPEKLRREKEELEMQKRKEKARLQAEAKAAENARKQAEAKAMADAKLQRELEREAARQQLQQMEKTVEISENSRFLQVLEMLSTAPTELLPSSVDETSPNHSQDGLGGFMFGGNNPLEQLGLYMKVDEEEEGVESPGVHENRGDEMDLNEVEEGEID